MSGLRPPRLRPGDTIGIVAPSNEVATRRAEVELGVARLDSGEGALDLLPDWAQEVVVHRPGSATGPLVGGNVPCAVHLLGTPYWPDAPGALVLLEGVRLTSAAMVRWLTQMRLSGALDRAGALVFGHLEDCLGDWDEPQEGLRWVIENGLGDLALPVFQVECFGHMVPNVVLPVGARATISEKGFRLVEPAVMAG